VHSPSIAPSMLIHDHYIGRVPKDTPLSSTRTLDTIPRPMARLPTADNLVPPSTQTFVSNKRKLSSKNDQTSPLKKSRTMPLECAKSGSKGKQVARDASADDVILAVYNSFVETCTCPMYVGDCLTYVAATLLTNVLQDVMTSCMSSSCYCTRMLTTAPARSRITSCPWVPLRF
jgi:hypothetical protein